MYFEQGGGQNDQKVAQKWYISSSGEKFTVDMAPNFFVAGKENYLPTSDSKMFLPTWSQHTSKGGVKKKTVNGDNRHAGRGFVRGENCLRRKLLV